MALISKITPKPPSAKASCGTSGHYLQGVSMLKGDGSRSEVSVEIRPTDFKYAASRLDWQQCSRSAIRLAHAPQNSHPQIICGRGRSSLVQEGNCMKNWTRAFSTSCFALLAALASPATAAPKPAVSLAGEWRFEIAGTNADAYARQLAGRDSPARDDGRRRARAQRTPSRPRSTGRTAFTTTPGRRGTSATSRFPRPGRGNG